MVARTKAQMQADHTAEAHKLRIDKVEALIKTRNDALEATMDYLFTQLHLMFDVFGRNNDYLTRLQREEQSIKARMDIRNAELAGGTHASRRRTTPMRRRSRRSRPSRPVPHHRRDVCRGKHRCCAAFPGRCSPQQPG